MFGSLGPMELVIIGVIAMLIFGPSQIPKIGRSIGDSIREFKGAGKELMKAIGDEDETKDKKA